MDGSHVQGALPFLTLQAKEIAAGEGRGKRCAPSCPRGVSHPCAPWPPTPAHLEVDVGTVVDKQLQAQGPVGGDGGEVQWGEALLVGLVDVGAAVHQLIGHGILAHVAGDVKCSVPKGVRLVDLQHRPGVGLGCRVGKGPNATRCAPPHTPTVLGSVLRQPQGTGVWWRFRTGSEAKPWGKAGQSQGKVIPPALGQGDTASAEVARQQRWESPSP